MNSTEKIRKIIAYNTPGGLSIEGILKAKQINYIKEWKPHLPDVKMKICNIGCGYGFLEYIIYNDLPNVEMWGIDRRGETKAAKYNRKFHKHEDLFKIRTDVKISEKFMSLNCKDTSRFHFFDTTEKDNINIKFDVILSQVSWCFHYPYEAYSEWVIKHSHKDTIVITNIRRIELEKIQNFHKESFEILASSKKSVLAKWVGCDGIELPESQ